MKMIRSAALLLAALAVSCASASAQRVNTLPSAATLTGSERITAVQGTGCSTNVAPCTAVTIQPTQLATYLTASFQPSDADLAAIAALATQPFGRSLLTQADAASVRAAIGLGSIATQAASAVAVTGGSVTGITDIAVADGGTGGSSASAARTNLGLIIGTNVQAYDPTLLSGQTAAPTLALLSGAGTGATISQTFSKGGGTITLALGTGATGGDLFTATYSTAFANRSHVVLFAGNSISAPAIGRNGYAAATATAFTVSSTSVTASTTLVIHYIVQGS